MNLCAPETSEELPTCPICLGFLVVQVGKGKGMEKWSGEITISSWFFSLYGKVKDYTPLISHFKEKNGGFPACYVSLLEGAPFKKTPCQVVFVVSSEANLNSFEHRSVATSFAWFVPYAYDSKQLKQRWLPSVRSAARWGEGRRRSFLNGRHLFGGHLYVEYAYVVYSVVMTCHVMYVYTLN